MSEPEKNYITPNGYRTLLTELDHLTTVERPRVTNEVTVAAAQGDRSENAEYIYGKRRLREIDRRMRFLRSRLDIAFIVDPKEDRGDIIYFGATVVLEDVDSGEEVSYQLVGSDEADARKGLISYRSPVGASLMGRTIDDEIRAKTPGGVRSFVVSEVHYK
ncbi:MAG: transcription elongation factor GreB [Deltaproteobacteria bacterium CG2_30_63_29]|nr:MAG: transcription elongation factor GreB [Deltaproteobacteria bacterium CG2_30_63_29]PJB42064.1 MAG: transcription elongation factor GreB [Deltaproteobacteria bacterium CG_4_9_14_3_um_filter_63_12]